MSGGIDEVSEKIGILSANVSTLTEAFSSLTNTIETQNDDTLTYRTKIHDENMKRDHDFSNLSKVVDGHQEIAKHISPEYLPDIDKNHEFTRSLRKRAEFWDALGGRVVEYAAKRGVVLILTLAIAAILYSLGLPEWAKKLAGIP